MRVGSWGLVGDEPREKKIGVSAPLAYRWWEVGVRVGRWGFVGDDKNIENRGSSPLTCRWKVGV